MTTGNGWKRPFDDPIPLPGGRQLVTLLDAGKYTPIFLRLTSSSTSGRPPIECLIGAAEGRDFVMHSRIGVLRALNRNVERTLTDRKEMHWGRRKLKRDQQ